MRAETEPFQTVVALSQFILLMVHYPEVQKRAQKELDAVLGPHKLPTHEDRPHLPYIDAILKETLRWGTPVSLSKR